MWPIINEYFTLKKTFELDFVISSICSKRYEGRCRPLVRKLPKTIPLVNLSSFSSRLCDTNHEQSRSSPTHNELKLGMAALCSGCLVYF